MSSCAQPGCQNPIKYKLSTFPTVHVDPTFKGTKEEKAARHVATEEKLYCGEHYLPAFQKELLRDAVKCIHLADPEAKPVAEDDETLTTS